MSDIELREGDFAALFRAPFECYGEDAYLSAPFKGDLKRSLDVRANPLFRDFARRTWFTAHRDGRIVGRILASIHDASTRLHGLQRGHFGLFDCIDDIGVASALLGAAGSWVVERGCTELAGSFNLTITQMIGVVTEGFDAKPYTYQDYSPPHIARLLDVLGFERFYPMRTFEIGVQTAAPDALLGPRQRALAADRDWRFLPVTRRNLANQLRIACGVLNDSFADNPMFVPLTEAEFLFPCAGMTWVIDETLSCIAYHRDEPVGVLLCVPDLQPLLHASGYRMTWKTPWLLWRSRQRRERAAVIFYAVRRDHHGMGVNGFMLHRLIEAMRIGGYRTLGVSWIGDGNAASLRQMEKAGARPLHRLHLFRKALA